MSYSIDRGFGYQQSPDPKSAEDLAEEMVRARKKFPSNELLLTACMEELGELAEAFMGREGLIKKEALQTACVAMRIYEEGDASFVPGRTDEPVFAMLVAAVGQVARALLQRDTGRLALYTGQVAGTAMRLAKQGDPMFANVTDAQAKP
jgi:hypothetical protein